MAVDKNEIKQGYRFHIIYSESEWKCITNQVGNYGYSNVRNFVYHRIRKQLQNLKESFGGKEKKVCQTFAISDAETIRRINSYCYKHSIQPVQLIRLLATDPLLVRCLLGEAGEHCSQGD